MELPLESGRRSRSTLGVKPRRSRRHVGEASRRANADPNVVARSGARVGRAVLVKAGHMRAWLHRFVAFVVVVVVVGLGSTSQASAATSGRDYTTAASPSWVAAGNAWSTDASVQDDAGIGVVDLFVDDQVRVEPGLELYMHHVCKVTSVAGIELAGEIEIVVDPTYARFVLHGLHIVRGERRIDAHKSATVRAYDSEQGREQHVYDGSRHIVFLLSDLRVGDVVDFEGSVIGQNPVFGGRVARWMRLASSRPTVYRRARVLAPASRPLTFRVERTTLPLTTHTIGRDTEMVWEQHDAPAFKHDGDEPSWYDATPALVVSEFRSWADVAQWAAPLFDSKAPPSAELAEKIREIRETHATAEARALAALRFVQDDVRYLGVELGEHSHRPHSASTVFVQRFGDCKDKVNLLLTMLHGLGVEAHAAFVDTMLDGHVADELPRPQAFDHVVARVRLDGREVWVDPTRSFERGPLGSTPLDHGRALVAAHDTTDLAVLGELKLTEPTTTVKELFRLKGDAATLHVTSTYRGRHADSMRHHLGTASRSKLKSSYLEFYTKRFEGAEATADIVIDDNEATNVLTVREAYELPTAVKQGWLSLFAHELSDVVSAPAVTHRSSPLAVAHPLRLRHEIEIQSDGREVGLPEHKVASDAALAFTMQSERRPHGIRVVFELASHADSVAVTDLQRHLDVLATIRGAINQDLAVSDGPTQSGDRQRQMSDTIVVVLIVVVVVVVGIAFATTFARRALVAARRWRWLRRAMPDQGQVPAKAVHARTLQDAERRLLGGRWECGHKRPPPPSAIVWSAMMFDGQRVSAARAECAACGEGRVRYFVLGDGAETKPEDARKAG
jgi:transglutaminase-like putative cysteine protease